jgi:hypothetical protein
MSSIWILNILNDHNFKCVIMVQSQVMYYYIYYYNYIVGHFDFNIDV